MTSPDPPSRQDTRPANDNGGDDAASPLDPRLRLIARAIGRHIAREFAQRTASVNDNGRTDTN